jgi:hypothetical protein
VLNIIDIKKCGSAMDGDSNPKVKVKGSNPHSCNPEYIGHLA